MFLYTNLKIGITRTATLANRGIIRKIDRNGRKQNKQTAIYATHTHTNKQKTTMPWVFRKIKNKNNNIVRVLFTHSQFFFFFRLVKKETPSRSYSSPATQLPINLLTIHFAYHANCKSLIQIYFGVLGIPRWPFKCDRHFAGDSGKPFNEGRRQFQIRITTIEQI